MLSAAAWVGAARRGEARRTSTLVDLGMLNVAKEQVHRCHVAVGLGGPFGGAHAGSEVGQDVPRGARIDLEDGIRRGELRKTIEARASVSVRAS